MVDASLRATILETLRNLQRDHGVSIIYITHDLTTAYTSRNRSSCSIAAPSWRRRCRYGDQGSAAPLYPAFSSTRSPGPISISAGAPQPIKAREAGGGGEGCRFRSRCPMAMEICKNEPPLFEINKRHTASCFLYEKLPQVAKERLSEMLPA